MNKYPAFMQTALKREYISVEDYLSGEEIASIKHEYVGGAVFAMAWTTTEHNQIAGSIYSTLCEHVKGRPCRVFMVDVKVRIDWRGEDTFHYPDVMMGCDQRDTNRLFLRYPKLLLEVSSESTERLDRGEKLLAYQTIETLEEYVIVEQERVEVTVFRRANKWKPEVISGLDQQVRLQSVDLTVPLATIYEGAVPRA
jgi:Uma2 family endonuclease